MTMEAGGTAQANMVVGSAAGSGRVPCTGWGWVGGSTVGLRQLASVVVSACDPRLVKSAGPFPCSGAKAAGVMAEQGLGARVAPCVAASALLPCQHILPTPQLCGSGWGESKVGPPHCALKAGKLVAPTPSRTRQAGAGAGKWSSSSRAQLRGRVLYHGADRASSGDTRALSQLLIFVHCCLVVDLWGRARRLGPYSPNGPRG